MSTSWSAAETIAFITLLATCITCVPIGVYFIRRFRARHRVEQRPSDIDLELQTQVRDDAEETFMARPEPIHTRTKRSMTS
ncbi:hypothetical protein FB567DRAFT_588060 [Paraphoma chrysanthemicola]|uniref:Uncharacterized protein n=1 Tax=Paraphoma chrysanthemicola TaxID=798071 RepID=A0A8K0RIM6_9PLEO|nr:hypothetical protein FB567DRAFT_588060 [Paraphoma chrysanthemicola]